MRVTSAPGTTLFESSTTVPDKEPVTDCAAATLAASSHKSTTTDSLKRPIYQPPLKSCDNAKPSDTQSARLGLS